MSWTTPVVVATLALEPQAIEAEKSLTVPRGFGSMKYDTGTFENGWPSTAATVGCVGADSVASATVAVVVVVRRLPPSSTILTTIVYVGGTRFVDSSG